MIRGVLVRLRPGRRAKLTRASTANLGGKLSDSSVKDARPWYSHLVHVPGKAVLISSSVRLKLRKAPDSSLRQVSLASCLLLYCLASTRHVL